MAPRTRLVAAAVGSALVATLAVGGCSGSPEPSPTGPPPVQEDNTPPERLPDAGAVAWMDGVCGQLLPITSLGEKISQTDGADADGLNAALTVVGDTLQQAANGLNGVGPSPIKGGDQVVGSVKDALGKAGTGIGDAKAKLAGGDVAAIGDALGTITGSLDTVNRIAEPQDNPDLQNAAHEAPQCQRLGANPG
jgi:hypothetical protein